MANETTLIKRIGTFQNKPRPILVEFKSKATVSTILKEKKKLRQSENWKNIYISMDTTAHQRKIMKNLRFELNQKRASGDDSWTIKYAKGVPSLVKKN